MMTGSIDETIGLIVGGAAVLGILVSAWRKTRRKWKEGKREARAFRDAILGRDEITHPDTGAILVHAVPGVGARMATIEDAVAKLADSHHRWDALEVRVAELEAKEKDRMLARTESIELMRTIDAALKADPNPEDLS